MEKIVLVATLALGVAIGLALPGPGRQAQADKVSQIETLRIG